MTTYFFALRLSQEADSDAFADALYADGHDCVLSTCDGVTEADFHRDADHLQAAIRTAIASVHRAGPTVRVTGVFLDDEQPIDEAFLDVASCPNPAAELAAPAESGK